ncbi:MAG: thymidine kinase [Clostridia bacterium]|nr:thymidine kinase [Clostridia bacterium]
MSKLYFKYGAMGSSKTAQALMTRFNYIQKGYDVLLIKPVIDNRDVIDGEIVVKSRIGIFASCKVFDKNTNLFDFISNLGFIDNNKVVIVDEVQFCSAEQIDQLHDVSTKVPVLCYGLLTNFKTQLFEGSKRLIEVAESISEIKSVCKCGRKATVNARFVDGKLVCDGEEIAIGADESYVGMCYTCYKELKKQI